jgi:hypothetical protein
VLEDRIDRLLGQKTALVQHCVPPGDRLLVAGRVLKQSGADGGRQRTIGRHRPHQVDPLDRDWRRAGLPDKLPRDIKSGEPVLEIRVMVCLLHHMVGLEPHKFGWPQRVSNAAGRPERSGRQVVAGFEQVRIQSGHRLAVPYAPPDRMTVHEFQSGAILTLHQMFRLFGGKAGCRRAKKYGAAKNRRQSYIKRGTQRQLNRVY